MHVGVIGINHKQAPLELRETIAKACQRRFGLENPLEEGSFVLLSTCNRSELYFSSSSLALTHEQIIATLQEEIADDFEQKLYTFFGFDCFMHLAKVTAGFDSAIIAETEIQGQVRLAYEQATKLRLLSKDLHYLFQKCLKIGKEVRSDYPIPQQVPDIEQALYWQAKEYFLGELPAVLFVGISDINLKIARYFTHKERIRMTFCNRTDQTSTLIAEELQSTCMPWSNLIHEWSEYDWVICATKSPHHLLTTTSSGNKNRNKKLLIDLAVPRNIDPLLETDHIKLLNIDDLNTLLDKRKALLKQEIASAEASLIDSVKRQAALFRTKDTLLPVVSL